MIKKYTNGSWSEIKYKKYGNKAEEFAEFPVAISGDGNDLTDYSIKGNMYQASGVSPTTPIQPQETGERTGNLSIKSTFSNVRTDTRNIFQIQANFFSNDSFVGNATIRNIYGTGAKQYTFDVNIANINKISIKHNGSNSDITIEYIEGNFNGKYTISFDLLSNNPTIKDGLKLSNIMLNTGSEALPYEKFGYKIPISSANTTTPVYLGEVETTRRIGKLVLDGTEQWQFFSDNTGTYGAWQFYVNDITNGLPMSSARSNIAGYGVTATTRSNYPYGVYLVTSGTGVAFQMAGAKDTFTNISSWKSYLQQQYANGTPVTVWYVLVTPTTGIVNEPLRKIGDYADTVSYEQAGVQIPTLHGNTVIDVDTTLKPSEMTLNWHGWHTADVKEYSNGEWR